MAWVGVRDEVLPVVGFGESFIREAAWEKVACFLPLNFSSPVKSRWPTALQKGWASKDGALLLATSPRITLFLLASSLGFTVDC